jgi:hypothetical protein
MTKRAASGLLIVSLCALAACGGAAAGEADQPRATPSTTAPATTTSTAPPPYSFDGSVPPPELVNTGTDYEAIYRSLSGYARWAESHNPDPTVAGSVYVVGTPTYEGFVNDLDLLRSGRLRMINVGASYEVSVVSVAEPIVSLRLFERVQELRLIDDRGRVARSETFDAPLVWNAVIAHDSADVWRIASVEPAPA